MSAPAKARDQRLDFFRGLGLLFIFINHIPDNAFSFLTLANFLFCDAAEIFVFLSGYAAALVFGRRARADCAAMLTGSL
ncbi:MAG: OpgC domain-containing protein, partial [Proteobacteria bacterium]|nr:OpgC domain-containing protein [Pseudomonadota bacterium]